MPVGAVPQEQAEEAEHAEYKGKADRSKQDSDDDEERTEQPRHDQRPALSAALFLVEDGFGLGVGVLIGLP